VRRDAGFLHGVAVAEGGEYGDWARQDSTKSLPPSRKSTGEFFRAGSVKRLCQKRAAAAM